MKKIFSVLAIILVFNTAFTCAQTWTVTGSLSNKRNSHTATLLNNNQVLVTGGYSTSGYLASCEIYNPVTAMWSSSGSLGISRANHTATLLASGKVLVAGGYNSADLTSCQIYDPATNTWSFATSMNTARSFHTATLLANGKVLVTGGINGSTYLTSTEIYDPTTSTWSVAGSMNIARALHTATLLVNGKVLVTGGYNSGGYLNSAEIFDPTTYTWSTAAPMIGARYGHAAVLLPNGKVLVAGGYNGGYLTSTQIYDMLTNTWTNTGSMNTARILHGMVVLSDGKALVTCGENSGGYLTSCELFNPVTATWSTTASANSLRGYHTTTLLANGKVMIAGGYDGDSKTSCEIYTYCENPASAGVIADNQSICPASVPAPLTSISLPTGHTGTLEYQWQLSTTSASAGFTDIPGANSAAYSPSAISTHSWFRRLSKVSCKSDWSGAAVSNVIEITMNPVYAFTENNEICNGDTYTWHGQSLTTAGTFHDDHLTSKGCDSTYTLNLTVNPVYSNVTDLEICDGDTALWQSGYYAAAGTYHADFLTTKGCDSTFTLNLTVNPVYAVVDDQEICSGDTITWQGTEYFASGTYHADYFTKKGCDSTFTLNLTVNPTYIISSAVEICNGDTYTWQGNDYTVAGNFTANYSSIFGCDSVYELELTVDTVGVGLTITDPTITADSIADAYQWIDCDNAYAPIGGANLQSYTATANGNYAVIVTQGLCSDTSACVPIVTVGIASENLPYIALYPNPSDGRFTLELNESANIEIYNALGSLIYNASFEKGKNTLSLNLADGVYLLKATNDNGSRSLRVVIQK